jgi:predicted DNA-binding protein
MLSIRLNKKNEVFLNELSLKLKKPKAFFINEALDEYLEDQLDYVEACEILANANKEDILPFNAKDFL